MKTIITFTTNPAIDKNSSVEHVVAEHKLYCKPPGFEPGGGAINVARAIKKLGGESKLVYTAGGYTGDRLNDLLQEESITRQVIPIEGITRESLIILEESTGLQYRFGMPGAVMQKHEWERCINELSAIEPPPDFLVLSGSLAPGVPPDLYAQIAGIQKKKGTKVIVDVSGEALKQAMQEGVFLIKPNVREFRNLVGLDIKDEQQIRAEAEKIVKNGHCQVIVISLGASGALVVSEDFDEHIHPPTVPVISKVGAGDSMVAGIVLSLAQGKNLRDAVRYGIASGTAAVTTPGSELCRKEDADRLFGMMMSEFK
ncbi:MAG: 1-phosphofructokinase family hexose kinase [Bacteroidetes bacterium]|nr:1-phosphofructokinase family hexose kinase [Bacteroidales bacterium]NJO69012.1 1-phosphofructokinase family hexose kinase [Bacteroidota bacterium]